MSATVFINIQKTQMDYLINELRKEEYKILDTILYKTIFIPEGFPVPPRAIINQPDLEIYIRNFGKYKDDLCLVCEVDNQIVGAVWNRLINDYGNINDKTPSLAISVLKKYRNSGIGTRLMKQMLIKLKSDGYRQVSLSVAKNNYAFHMYQKLGFEILTENKEDYIMACWL